MSVLWRAVRAAEGDGRMSEYIERGETIGAIVKVATRFCRDVELVANIIHAVETIPAANVRPAVKAKWEQVEVTYDTMNVEAVASMFCPKCKRYHNEVFFYGNPRENANYCPNCGASMVSEDG